MRWLIGIMTCHENYAKADAQRDTWVKDVRALGIADVRFFLGAPRKLSDRMPREDETWLDVDDTYFGLTNKVQVMCAWSAAHGYDRHSKCDDDVYIAPKRLVSLPFYDYDYIGRFRGPHGNYPSSFASGFFYTLSRRADEIVASERWNGDWLEERFVANALALRGIYGYNDPVNYQVCGPMMPGAMVRTRPIFKNGTVFCEYRANQMEEMHEAFRYAPPVPNHPGLRELPRVSITREQFDAKPIDKPPQHKVERFMR